MSKYDDYQLALFQQCATDLEESGMIHQRLTRKQREEFESWRLKTEMANDANKQQELKGTTTTSKKAAPVPNNVQARKIARSTISKAIKWQALDDERGDDEYQDEYEDEYKDDEADDEDDLIQQNSRNRVGRPPRLIQDKRSNMSAKRKKESDSKELEGCKQTTLAPSSPKKSKRRTSETDTVYDEDEDVEDQATTSKPRDSRKPRKPTTNTEKKKGVCKKGQRAPAESPKKQGRPTKIRKKENYDDNEKSVSSSPFAYPLKILPNQLVLQDDLIGEGRIGRVVTAKYGQLLVACKTRRTNQPRIQFEQRLARELEFAALLSVCRAVNQYVGVLSCKRSDLVYKTPRKCQHGKDEIEHFAVQRYYKHGDLLEYLDSKNSGRLHPLEILRIAINLFSAITDAHDIGIGLVDIKRENVLIDNSGSAVLTDFGSCVRMDGAKFIMLEDTEDGVNWTDEVAAPEMIDERKFYLASDVFMGTVIVGELLMSPMKSESFQSQVLRRRRRRGVVDFQSEMIPLPLRAFCPLLQMGFHNDPRKRLTAAKALNFVEQLHSASFAVSMKQQLRVISNENTFTDNQTYTSNNTSIQEEDDDDTDVCMADQSSLSSNVSLKEVPEYGSTIDDGTNKWPADPQCYTLAPMDREKNIHDLRIMAEAGLNRSDGYDSRNSPCVTAEDSDGEPEEDQVQLIPNSRHVDRLSPPFDDNTTTQKNAES
ncbi:kinase-like domain-containing protein [Zychaea mexicana]|uniref:kinase-like domain-containing protein n=1 Tax=Zychaea mexicana TaxID=64656 RepID=UPI0022FDD937|nr:kinase-like domain-containing protein [Zychaea mexicana]KAI9497816.1 kinase-like domain-containing protein [Zychaea mexicana]